jgi:hypothetical protein
MADRGEHRREIEELEARVKARADQRALAYRGADNPGNPHGPKVGESLLRGPGVPMILEPRRVPERPGRRSRRWRRNRWVVA